MSTPQFVPDVKCMDCDGHAVVECHVCSGTGELMHNYEREVWRCDNCDGRGMEPCELCGGEGCYPDPNFPDELCTEVTCVRCKYAHAVIGSVHHPWLCPRCLGRPFLTVVKESQ